MQASYIHMRARIMFVLFSVEYPEFSTSVSSPGSTPLPTFSGCFLQPSQQYRRHHKAVHLAPLQTNELQSGPDASLFSKPFLILGDCLFHSPQPLLHLHQYPHSLLQFPFTLRLPFFKKIEITSVISLVSTSRFISLSNILSSFLPVSKEDIPTSSSKLLLHQLCPFSCIVIIFLSTGFYL